MSPRAMAAVGVVMVGSGAVSVVAPWSAWLVILAGFGTITVALRRHNRRATEPHIERPPKGPYLTARDTGRAFDYHQGESQ